MDSLPPFFKTRNSSFSFQFNLHNVIRYRKSSIQQDKGVDRVLYTHDRWSHHESRPPFEETSIKEECVLLSPYHEEERKSRLMLPPGTREEENLALVATLRSKTQFFHRVVMKYYGNNLTLQKIVDIRRNEEMYEKGELSNEGECLPQLTAQQRHYQVVSAPIQRSS